MEVRGILKGLLGIAMICCFLSQMWDLFDQFLNELKTVAVSFEEKKVVEFPSFAFCDNTAFKNRIGVIASATLYNATAYNVEVTMKNAINFTIQSVSTTDNGYCTLYESNGELPVNKMIGNLKQILVNYKIQNFHPITFQNSCCLQIDLLMCSCLDVAPNCLLSPKASYNLNLP